MEVLHEVMHLVRASRHRDIQASGLGLAHMEAKVLGLLVRRPGATLTQAAEHFGRDKSQLARLVATLRDRGWVEDRPDPEDKRRVCMHPTAEAKRVVESWRAGERRRARRAVAGLSAPECEQILGLLQRIRANLADEDS